MQDRYGYKVSSSSARAVEQLDEAVRVSTSLRADAGDAYNACLAEDPDLALAHAGLAVVLHLGGQDYSGSGVDRRRPSLGPQRNAS